jgi:hypothetical protein
MQRMKIYKARDRVIYTDARTLVACIHGFRGPNARTLVASTIPWTERQNSHCVHGFRGPNARSIVAFTDFVDYSTRILRIPTQ